MNGPGVPESGSKSTASVELHSGQGPGGQGTNVQSHHHVHADWQGRIERTSEVSLPDRLVDTADD